MLIYLAAPYGHEDPVVMAQRREAITAATKRMIRGGLRVFSPITYSAELHPDGEPPDGWYEFDLEFVRRSDMVAVLTLPGWKESRGVGLEIDLAEELGLPVYSVDPNLVVDFTRRMRKVAETRG